MPDVDAAAPPALVGPYLAAALGDPAWLRCEVALLSGGASNLSVEVTCAAGAVVLRRPPMSHRLPKAHDMAREFRLLTALEPTAVPVPRPLASYAEEDLLGVPFYVMERVRGHVLHDQLPPGFATEPDERRGIGEALVATLASLHELAPASVGLDGLGRAGDFLERQVATWRRQWDRVGSVAREADSRSIGELAADLERRRPRQGRAGIVHGDYRLGNVMLDHDRPQQVVAVLDWEMATVGDVLTDLAVLLMFWREDTDGEDFPHVISTTTAAAGFPSRADLVENYARLSGRDLGDLSWYYALASFKYAVICADVASRGRAGAMLGNDFSHYVRGVGSFAALGHRALAGHAW